MILVQGKQEADYRDATPNNFPDDYDRSEVDPRVLLRTDAVLTKMKGKYVRAAMAQAEEISSVHAKKAYDLSNNIGQRFDDQIAGSNLDDEAIDFRHSDMLNKSFQTARNRGDFFDQEFTSRGVNVEWFGALGDGETDDTSSINAAINYAANQGVTEVYLPAGSYRITSSIILPNQFTLQGAGHSANNTGATEIIKDGDFDAIWIKGNANRVSGITVTGSVGNSGDGIWVTGSRATLAEVEVTGQGGNGIRIGNKVAGTNYNANLFDLSNVIITKCQDGLNIHDENNHDLPNAGGGTIYHLDVRECNRGLYINASIDTVLYNPVVQLSALYSFLKKFGYKKARMPILC